MEKNDLRNQPKDKSSVTPPEALQAGIDNPKVVNPTSGLNELTPDKKLPEGQVTRNS